MSNNRAAIRYAKAVLSLSEELKSPDETYSNMKLIAATISESDELQLVLSSSIVKSVDKKKALIAIFGNQINSVSKKVFDLLIENKRLPILENVAAQYVALYDKQRGKEEAFVTTAVPLTDELYSQVLKKVKELTGKEAILKNIVNPEVLGGFVLRVGDIQYDASIANKLNVLKREFSA